MDIFTVTANKIRFWERVRDLPSFKDNIENTNNIVVDCYIKRDRTDFLSVNYTTFKVEGNYIILQRTETELVDCTSEVGWPNMNSLELNENYNSSEILQIAAAKRKYELQDLKSWDKIKHLKMVDSYDEIPDDFPNIERAHVTFKVEEPVLKEIARIKVEKYEV